MPRAYPGDRYASCFESLEHESPRGKPVVSDLGSKFGDFMSYQDILVYAHDTSANPEQSENLFERGCKIIIDFCNRISAVSRLWL
jgi:hypothetical protein